jgi:hypothetical protein
MTRHRTIFSTLLLLAAFAAVPNAALAGSLLSGYGAPGGGAQAILGSTLVNGPGGPGSAGGEGSAVTAAGGPSVAGLGQAGGGQGVAGHTLKGASGTRPGATVPDGVAQSKHAAGASAGASATYTSPGSPRVAAGLSAADDMGAWGFTGTDLLLLLLVVGVLAITTDLTRRLAGTRHYR